MANVGHDVTGLDFDEHMLNRIPTKISGNPNIRWYKSDVIKDDWDQFHSLSNLTKSIVIEATELLECFQWSDDKYDLQHIKKEVDWSVLMEGFTLPLENQVVFLCIG